MDGKTRRFASSLMCNVTIWALIVGLLCSVLMGMVHAGSPDEDSAWRTIGEGIPAQVGVVTVAIAPSDPRIMYMATAEPGGLYRSDDGGFRWERAANGLSVGVLSVTVHPTDPYLVYAGTVNGVYRTAGLPPQRKNEGDWRYLPALDVSFVYAVSFVTEPAPRVLAGSEQGVFWSEDSGETWYRGGVDCAVLSLSTAADGTVYAGTEGQGVMVSRDGGLTWDSAGGRLAQETIPIVQVDEGGIVYALAGDRLFYAAEGIAGELPLHWQEIELPAGWTPFSFAVGHISAPGSEHRRSGPLYVGSRGKGVVVSVDPLSDNPVWYRAGDELRRVDITCLTVHPEAPNVAFLGTKFNGLYRMYRTGDGGTTWELVSEEVGLRTVMALARHPSDRSMWYAGTVDGVYGSSDDGQTWQLLTTGVGRLMVQDLAVDLSVPEWIYAATHIGVFQSEDGGTSWRRSTEELGTINVFNVTVSRPVASGEKAIVYAGSWGNNVLRSRDDGRTWAPIHNGLETLSVHAFAVDPGDPNVLYAGTVERVYKSDDGGASWYVIDDGMRSAITTFDLVIDPHRSGRIYAGTTAGVYRSDNDGMAWVYKGDGLGELTVNALAIDPGKAETLYAGTEHHGMYLSIDGGGHWIPWGLKDLSIYSIVIDDSGRIWAGTEEGVFKKGL